MGALNDQYQDEVLVTYVKEISDLLESKDGSLISDRLTYTLARVKTLNTLGQLDGTRQPRILRFLFEARQLTSINESVVLDISTAKLRNVNFWDYAPLAEIRDLSLIKI